MKKDYHEFKKEYHIFSNIFNIIAVTWAASFSIGILTLFSVLFIKLPGYLYFIEISAFIISTFFGAVFAGLDGYYKKEKEKYTLSEQFIFNPNNYQLLSALDTQVQKSNLLDSYFKKVDTIIIRKFDFGDDYNHVLIHYYELIKNKNGGIEINVQDTSNSIDLDNPIQLIKLYDDLKESELDFKIYNEMKLNQKISFLKENSNIFSEKFDAIDQIESLREQYRNILVDIKQVIIDHVQTRKKDVENYINSYKNRESNEMKEQVKKAFSKIDVIKNIRE